MSYLGFIKHRYLCAKMTQFSWKERKEKKKKHRRAASGCWASGHIELGQIIYL